MAGKGPMVGLRAILASNIGRSVREILRDKGWSQQRLGDALGVSESTIRAYVKGDVLPSLPMLCVLAHVLGTTPDKLMGYKTRSGE